MSYIFWKLLVQRLILAINQFFWSILRGVRILLTHCNRIVLKIWHHVLLALLALLALLVSLALLALLALVALLTLLILHALLALLALPVSIVLLALLCDFWWSLLLSNWKNIAFLTQSYRFGCLSVNSSHMRHRSQCEASWGTPHISTCFQPESVKTNQQIVKPEWAKVWSQLWVHLQPFFLALSAYLNSVRQRNTLFWRVATKESLS